MSATDSSPMARYPGLSLGTASHYLKYRESLSPIQHVIGGKTGATYGIGVMVDTHKANDGALVVQWLVSGSSAEKSGAVVVGDRLLRSTESMSFASQFPT